MIRPAHSLGKLEGAGNLGVLIDPSARVDLIGCVDPASAEACLLPEQNLVEVEYRLGLGKGFELGGRGLFPPRALSLKYSVLDERRHPTAVSVALQAEGGVGLVTSAPLSFAPMLRFDALTSATARLSPTVQLRPAASAGWWIEPRGDVAFNQGFGWTAGLFVPVRIPGSLGFAPYAGASGWLPVGRAAEVYARFGFEVEPWLDAPPR